MARETFRIGTPTLLNPSDLADRSKEAKALAADYNRDGVVTLEEALSVIGPPGGLQPSSVDDYYPALGGKQHEVKLVPIDGAELLYDPGIPAKGDFRIGPNYGNVKAGPSHFYNYETNKSEASYRFGIELDGFDRKFVDQDIRSANIMIGPKNFRPEPGNVSGESVPEQIAIPLNVATREASRFWVQNRFGGQSEVIIPEKKMLGAQVDPADLAKLAGDTDGLSFYVRLDLTDGSTQYVNLNGQAGNNFEIAKSELQPRGTP